MALDLDASRIVVDLAIRNGLQYDTSSPLSSTPEEFARTFREFDEQVVAGNELQAAWRLTHVYRPPADGPVAEATTLFAAQNLTEFIERLEPVVGSQLVYDLAGPSLFVADLRRCCEWVKISRSKRLVSLGIAAALRCLIGERHTQDLEWDEKLGPLVDALRARTPAERCNLWWQIAASARYFGAADTWNPLSHVLWVRASTEIAATGVPEARLVPSVLLARCKFLYALLPAIAERTGDRASGITPIMENFIARLEGDECDVPQVRDEAETRLFLPACGWAIAQEIGPYDTPARWELALEARLPRYPVWRLDRGNHNRCALLLLAACHAVLVLHAAGKAEAAHLRERINQHADRWLPAWLFAHSSAQSPARKLALALISVEAAMDPTLSDAGRLLRIMRDLRDANEIRCVVNALEDSGVLAAETLAALRDIEHERTRYESRLRQVTSNDAEHA